MIYPNQPYVPNIKSAEMDWKSAEMDWKPVEAGTKTAHIVFILDDSGSMGSVRDATISGFNEFLLGQKRSEVPTRVSLYTFGGIDTKLVYSRIPAPEAPDLTHETYAANGYGTNLLDAIGDVLITVNTATAKTTLVADRDSITVVILTDGAENCSRKFDKEAISKMVKTAESYNWAFMFLGANIDAFSTGASLGFIVSNTMQYKTSNMADTMKSASRMAVTLNNTRAAGMDVNTAYAAAAFTAAERKEADK